MYNPALIFDRYRRLTIASIVTFLVGGFGYYAIEVLYRGFSHVTMWFCGAVCLLGILLIEWTHTESRLIKKALYSALFITVTELLFGLVFNLWLQYNVWDYSDVPLNLFGQISLPFTLLWFLLSIPALLLCRVVLRAAGLPVGRQKPTRSSRTSQGTAMRGT